MKFEATPQQIRRILNAGDKYIVPEYQRDYQWGRDEWSTLWNDLIDNLTISRSADGKISFDKNDYFIGFLVTAGDNSYHQVIDGQQRLTTLLILLAALLQCIEEGFKDDQERMQKKTRVLRSAIFGSSDDGEELFVRVQFKLSERNGFFESLIKHPIQTVEEKTLRGAHVNADEKNMMDAFSYFQDRLKKEALLNLLEKKARAAIPDFTEDDAKAMGGLYWQYLVNVQSQIFDCEMISVSVDTPEEGYEIFEILNSKGKNLSAVDIIKSSLFRSIGNEYQDAQSQFWNSMKSNIESADETEDRFFMHFWLSNYGSIPQRKLVKEFAKKEITANSTRSMEFIKQLEGESELYKYLVNAEGPFKKLGMTTLDSRRVQRALANLSVFKVTQPRIFLLALFDQCVEGQRDGSKLIKIPVLVETIEYIEYFHMVYSFICKLSANRLTGRYTKTAVKIRAAKTNQAVKRVCDELRDELDSLLPTEDQFIADLEKFSHSDKVSGRKKKRETRAKALYLLRRIEIDESTGELFPDDITIEHILSQSNAVEKDGYGKLGNLLPLAKGINSNAGNTDFETKVNEYYRHSDFASVKDFCLRYGKMKSWKIDDIDRRTRQMAKALYSRKSLSSIEDQSKNENID